MLDFNKTDLMKLNSLTKYPSIGTFHALGERGRLEDEAMRFAGRVIAREKIDGTNARMIFAGEGAYLIGSREELLHHAGDLIANPALGIVDALRELADWFGSEATPDGGLLVCYGEVYGGNVTAQSKQYTGTKKVGFRLFDVAVISDPTEMLSWSAEQIAAWRDAGGQSFMTEDALRVLAAASGIPLAPLCFEGDAGELGASVEEAHTFLAQKIRRSECALDEGAGRVPEGLIVRSPDRKQIAKLRFEDYERSLRARIKN